MTAYHCGCKTYNVLPILELRLIYNIAGQETKSPDEIIK